ncbi:MAG: SLOG family protein (plasmid) [Candidatus Methanoperedens sp.]|uniref:SLOG family protein n=1 Tax=Candidatus Methanoperedens sp. BLZ2 TaxID=2035255 RepID=UPI000BE41F69|nr:SLOG family protein [Candidatus Methanoperedens sp. BLZ2]KAB2946414.1 MAG: DUF2493 domain-containing protein [Candidatus Methanoperedens sp.]MBZ0175650.1 DUF2493 domain-containing protein [Candidatus Methanoperedens nitroreducens]WAH95080.1 MAG: SLOG family protein [Candidatus Methanoperedens sp.]WAM22198.1 MAG: SLOG family protein [Candidatus Methanoperedens sp.]
MVIRGQGYSWPGLGITMDRIAFTGHRHLRSSEVVPALAAIHAKYPDAIWITGGAIGLDSLAAEYARTHGITLWLILPFPQKVMTAKWNKAQVDMLRSHIAYCSKLSVLAPVYKASVYQDRNVRMVDLSSLLCAFFDGSPGGTANCVHYARSIGHPIQMCL